MPLCCATRSSACARRQTRNNMTTRKELLPGVFLTSIQDGRFKTACFSLSFLRPLRAGEAAMNALLPSVLLRGSEKTPSIRAIADRLDELHGASIGALVRKKGEIQLTGLFADCLEDQYAGEAVFRTCWTLSPSCCSARERNTARSCRSLSRRNAGICKTPCRAYWTTRARTVSGSCSGPCAGANATPAAVSESRKSLIKSTCARSGRTISRCWPRRARSFSISAANPSEKRRRCCSRFWRICRARPASRSEQTPPAAAGAAAVF